MTIAGADRHHPFHQARMAAMDAALGQTLQLRAQIAHLKTITAIGLRTRFDGVAQSVAMAASLWVDRRTQAAIQIMERHRDLMGRFEAGDGAFSGRDHGRKVSVFHIIPSALASSLYGLRC
jgi:hypothetical protein